MFYNSFPNDLWEDLNSIIPVLPIETFNNIRKTISEDTVSYILDCREIKFPYRIYFMDIDDPRYNSLTERQKQILSILDAVIDRLGKERSQDAIKLLNDISEVAEQLNLG